MSGQPKRGLEFAGWDVHMFDDDERIDELIDAQGWTGFSVYFYLSMKAFATNGFYYSWRDTSPASIARRMSGGIKSETVKQVVQLCLRIGLFDKGLYDREGVLTNKDIQIRYMNAIEKRSLKGRTIEKKFWLLKKEETKAYIVISENAHSLPENATKESKVKESKVKESKVKESKVKESTILAPSFENSKHDAGDSFIKLPLNDKTFYTVTKTDVEHYKELYPAVDVEQELRSILGWLEANPRKRKTRSGIKAFVTKWLSKTQNQGGVGYGSYPGSNVKNSVTGESRGTYRTGEKVF